MQLNCLRKGSIASFWEDGIPFSVSADGATGNKGISCKTDFYEKDGAIGWTLKIRNDRPEKTGQITDFCGVDVFFPLKPSDPFTFYGIRGDDCSGNSYLPVEQSLSVGESFRQAPVGGRCSNTTAFPFFDLRIGDDVVTVGLGWAGQWFAQWDRTEAGVHFTAGIEECDFFLYPGEEVRSLKVVLYSVSSDLLKNRQGFRRWMRLYNSPYTLLGKDPEVPMAVAPFDRYYWNNTEGYRTTETQVHLCDVAGACRGFDTFWVDAMWFRDAFPYGVGNYELAPEFGKTLRPISDAAHRNGMRFMVWFEPERINTGSDAFKNYSDRPGFFLDWDEETRPGNRLLNLGNPEAFEWISTTLIRFIEENGIDIYREDFNMNPLGYWRQNDEPGRKGMLEIRFVENYYRLWDTILDHFPGMLIDNCSSGGRRLDLETVARSVPCWQSDIACWNDTEERPVCAWKQNQHMTLSRYLPYHQLSSWSEAAYDMRSSMMEGMATEFDFMNPDFDPEKAHAALDEVNRLRYSWRGDYIPLTEPSTETTGWHAFQLDCGDHGTAFAFRRRDCEQPDYTLSLCLPADGSRYEVTVWDEQRNAETKILTGQELRKGILLRTDAPRSSFALEYRVL